MAPHERDTSGPGRDHDRERDDRTGKTAAYQRMQQQTRWVDLLIKQAQQRGDFDDLPGFGKPIESLGRDHDPDWWVKQLVEREQISGVLPPALQLRTDDARLDDRLDRIASEREVRAELEDFNERVRKARIQPLGGPPMITRERDVDEEVQRWAERREARQAAQAAQAARETERARRESAASTRRRWRFRR